MICVLSKERIEYWVQVEIWEERFMQCHPSHCNYDSSAYPMYSIRAMVTVGHNAIVLISNWRLTAREETVKVGSEDDIQCYTWDWPQEQSNLQPACLWYLWWNAFHCDAAMLLRRKWCLLIHRSSVRIRLIICDIHVCEQPVQCDSKLSYQQLMRFIKLPMVMDIACRVWPHMAGGLVNTYSLNYVSSHILLRLTDCCDSFNYWGLEKLNSSSGHCVESNTSGKYCSRLQHSCNSLEYPRSSLPKDGTIPSELISRILLGTISSYIKILECVQPGSNCIMLCLRCVIRTFGGTCIHPKDSRGVLFRNVVDTFLNNTKSEIQLSGQVSDQKIERASSVRCLNNCHNCGSSWKFIMLIPSGITSSQLTA
jgi:hypothetical protein